MITFAAISGSSLLGVIIWLIVAACVYFVIDWGLKQIALPDPFGKLARVILILVTVVLIVNALLGLTPNGGFLRW